MCYSVYLSSDKISESKICTKTKVRKTMWPICLWYHICQAVRTFIEQVNSNLPWQEWQTGIFLVKILFVIVYVNKQLYLNLFTKDEAHNLSNQSNHTSTAKYAGRQAFFCIDFSGTIHLLLSSMAEWQGMTSGILICIVDKCHTVSFLQHCYHDCRITENFS